MRLTVDTEVAGECFILKLDDFHAAAALKAYAISVLVNGDNEEYARKIFALSKRCAAMPNRKFAD